MTTPSQYAIMVVSDTTKGAIVATCLTKDCNRNEKYLRKGLCNRCRLRMAKHGNTSTNLIPTRYTDNVGYQSQHRRVQTARGIASSCVWGCDSEWYEWANLTGNYIDIWDFAAMCRQCHRSYDEAILRMSENFAGSHLGKTTKLSDSAVREIRQLYKEGYNRESLSTKFGVSKASISNVIRRRTWEWVL